MLVHFSVAATACGQIGTLNPAILEGREFAHSIQFPSAFHPPEEAKGRLPFFFDHYTFRRSAKAADALLVSACRYVSLSEICSVNSFAIDTEHNFAVRESIANEWDGAAPITEEKEMRDPYRRILKQELAKPASLKPIPIIGRGDEDLGYKYRGKEYLRRNDWIVSLSFADSEDGTLVVLAGVDKRKFPSQEPGLVSSAVNTGISGLVAIDVYAPDPSHHVAALDLDCHTNVNVARRRISLVNSRWLAIGLDADMQKMLIFDFKGTGAPTK